MSAATQRKRNAEADLPRIFTVRGRRVVLDSDLAKLYGVPTFRLNESVKRNQSKFPEDFAFFIPPGEVADLISQNAISNTGDGTGLKSQIATSRRRRGGRRKPARVFTEHGALMAANILRSGRAVEMSIYLVRAFVQMRETMLANAAILKRLAEIDRRLVEHDSVLREIVERLQPLLDAPDDPDTKPKIGYHQGNR